jgi:type IV secretory pathway VirB10-like protein
MAILSTLTGWVAVIALGGGYYYYVKEKKTPPTATKQTSKSIDSKEPKAKKAPVKSEKATKKKTQQPTPNNDKQDQGHSTAVSNDRDDEVDNKEFARQISNIKSGHVPAGKAKTEKKQKSVKQSKAQEKKATAESSDNADAPSSATGGDADDDQSSVNSPELNASAEATPVTVFNTLLLVTLSY